MHCDLMFLKIDENLANYFSKTLAKKSALVFKCKYLGLEKARVSYSDTSKPTLSLKWMKHFIAGWIYVNGFSSTSPDVLKLPI